MFVTPASVPMDKEIPSQLEFFYALSSTGQAHGVVTPEFIAADEGRVIKIRRATGDKITALVRVSHYARPL